MMSGVGSLEGNLALTASLPQYGEKSWKKNIAIEKSSFTVNAGTNSIDSNGQFDLSSMSTAATDWRYIVSLVGHQEYSEDKAHARATAYIMQQAGVTLIPASSGSDVLKKIGLRHKRNPDGTLAYSGGILFMKMQIVK